MAVAVPTPLHVNRMKHKQWGEAASSSQSVSSIFKAKANPLVIEAEAAFVAKHNLAFLSSDHATVLFKKMFPNSDIAKKFSCGRTKTTSIIKSALVPHFHKKVTDMVARQPFSIMIDESNDKTDKSSIVTRSGKRYHLAQIIILRYA